MLFSEIAGQAEIKKRLIGSVQSGRISHAQLFLGPEGCGSLALALAYAQYICCTGEKGEDSCGKCPSCVKYAKLAHPDLHFVFPVTLSKDVRSSVDLVHKWREEVLSNPYLGLNGWIRSLEAENKQAIIGTEESADILKKLSLTTYESEYKIMILWLPEKMNTAAANKLLKIFEEPPDKTLFILVCEHAEQMLATVLSRTQLIKINKVSALDMKQFLVEKKSIDEENALRIVHLADGNMNQALMMCGEEADNLLPFFDTFGNWMRACFKFDARKVLGWVDSMAAGGREKQKSFLQYSLHMLRECIVHSYGDASILKLDEKELEFVKKFSPFIHTLNAPVIIEELDKASHQIERNAHPKILFLDLSFRLNELLNQKA